ncbi:MAG: dTDP-4-amino-4,6-dideoxygalactose transaminase [Fuerstiella sp.]
MKIPFNKPFVAGKELFYIAQAVTMGNLGGDGHFTRACCKLLEETLGINKVLLTPSCTAALEMAAMLCDLKPGDEVIMPSFTFVSTAQAVVREGATPVFIDVRNDTMNMDETLIESAITPQTKAIFVVHYAGVAAEMDAIMEIAARHNLLVVEDAAQGLNAFYRDRPLGSIGHLGCFSFHETKNYICGEGGALCINDDRFTERAEIIRDKGTNRQQFFRGATDKYRWVDKGSSYVPSEICSAFLLGQLESLTQISQKRQEIYETYDQQLQQIDTKNTLQKPIVPAYCTSNFHMYFVVCKSAADSDTLLACLRDHGIHAVFHYTPLHSSPMGLQLTPAPPQLPVTDVVSKQLLRLPMFYEITKAEQTSVCNAINEWLKNR